MSELDDAIAYGEQDEIVPVEVAPSEVATVETAPRRVTSRAPRQPPAGSSRPDGPDRPTEAGAAERFARLHGDDVKWDHSRGRWLLWSGVRWVRDVDAEIVRLGLRFARTWMQEALDITDDRRRRDTLNAALKLDRRDALDSMLKFAAALHPIADRGTAWDADPWLLGVPNGTIDLRTGEFRAGCRNDRITLSTGVPYDVTAASSLWEDTLSAVLPAEGLVEFLQVALGYSITGDTRRDCWFLATGSGRNGKGTVYEPVRRALGDYAVELPASVLDSRRDSAPYDLAVLPGKRFVISSETGDTIKLNHDRMKQLTGGSPVRAANKYERSFEFDPVCKLWLAANRRPRTSDDSPAFWARVMNVPFAVSFAGRENRDLRPTLEREPEHQAAILAWLVKGAVAYFERGLNPPNAVTAETDEYRRESDPIAEFLADAIERDENSEMGAGELYDWYVQWTRDEGFAERERLTGTAFGKRIKAVLGKPVAKKGRKYYGGVARRVA